MLCEVCVNDVVAHLKSIRMFRPKRLNRIHFNWRQKKRYEYEPNDLLKIVSRVVATRALLKVSITSAM